MRRRSRLLRVAKWGFTAASLLIFSIWGWSLAGGSVFPMENIDIDFYKGHVTVEWGTPQAIAFYSGMAGNRWGFDLPRFLSRPGWSQVRVPLWCPLLVALVPAAYLWRADRRHPKPGHCPCGYDLTGNVSGVCPECGRWT